jgi:hypothetical protein
VRRQGRRLMARQAGRRASGRCVRASLRGARRPQPALGRGWSGAEHAAAHRKAVRCRSSRPAQPDQPLQPALRPSWSRPARWEAGPRPVVVTAPSCARNYSARALRPAASRCGSVAIGAESRAAEPKRPEAASLRRRRCTALRKLWSGNLAGGTTVARMNAARGLGAGANTAPRGSASSTELVCLMGGSGLADPLLSAIH